MKLSDNNSYVCDSAVRHFRKCEDHFFVLPSKNKSAMKTHKHKNITTTKVKVKKEKNKYKGMYNISIRT